MHNNKEETNETFSRYDKTGQSGPSVVEDLVQEFLGGSARAAARIITFAENRDPIFFELMRAIYPHTGKAHVIGITGAPGTGKSTLADAYAALLRQRDFTVGIIVVDPSSPFAGGALLGDRIRMQRLCLDPGVFIRSMATRGHVGGLAPATNSIVRILDAFGKDIIIVETVGSGQDEIDIAGTADTTILVLAPGPGDAIQSMKNGIMEIADIYVINMADREGAEQLFNQVKMRTDQDFNLRENAWRVPALLTAAIQNKGITEMADAVESHRHFLMTSDRMRELRREKAKQEILRLLEQEITEHMLDYLGGEGLFDDLIDAVVSRRKDPYTGVRDIVRTILPKHS